MPVATPDKPAAVNVLNKVGRAAQKLGMTWPSLHSERFVRSACKKTGLSDFGGVDFEPGLQVFLEAVDDEARLSPLGRIMCHKMIGGYLENLLLLAEHRKTHPEVATQQIEQPVFIVGLPRTGTTITFNLFAEDPRHHAPVGWELHWPHPPPKAATFNTDPRVAEGHKMFDNVDRLVPTLAAMHKFGSDLPQECIAITGHTFKSVQFLSTYNVPTFHSWYETQDRVPVYRFHKQFLQHLQSDNPNERWILKSPEHLSAIDSLLAIYPDAKVVHTHRDPAKVVASLCSLTHALRSMATDHLDPVQIGQQVLEHWGRALDLAVRDRERHSDKPDQFIDVRFNDVVKDPVDVVLGAYRHFGFESGPDLEAAMRQHITDNPRHKHGQHRYQLSDFGLTPQTVRARFANYYDAFGGYF